MAVITAREFVAYTDQAVAEHRQYILGGNGNDVLPEYKTRRHSGVEYLCKRG